MATTTLPGGMFTMAPDLTVTRVGYGAMQLAGPHVFGPPADRDAAVAVLGSLPRVGDGLVYRQQDVGKDRPFEELELPLAGRLVLVDHLGAGDV